MQFPLDPVPSGTDERRGAVGQRVLAKFTDLVVPGRGRQSWALALCLGPLVCAAQDLTIAVSRTSLSLPLYVAETQKFFSDEGLVVRTVECLGGQRCIKQMFEGEVQLATASKLPVMFNSFSRTDYAIVATFVTSPLDVKLVARKSAGIGSAAQLIGKRVGTVKGASAHYFLDTFLLINGLDPKKVDLV